MFKEKPITVLLFELCTKHPDPCFLHAGGPTPNGLATLC